MKPCYTIGELARRADVPTSTVRYYERTGLVRPEGRTDGNYRYYGTGALQRLRFIRAAQGTGFTLDDVKTLLALRDGEAAPCQEVQVLIEERIAGIKDRLADLHQVERVLRSGLRLCRKTEKSGRCEVLEDLSRSSRSPRKPVNRSHRKKRESRA